MRAVLIATVAVLAGLMSMSTINIMSWSGIDMDKFYIT